MKQENRIITLHAGQPVTGGCEFKAPLHANEWARRAYEETEGKILVVAITADLWRLAVNYGEDLALDRLAIAIGRELESLNRAS